MHNPNVAAAVLADPALDPALAAARRLDSHFHAAVAPAFSGLSPISLALAWQDWALHLATQPATALALVARAQQSWLQAWGEMLGHAEPGNGDARFAAPAWKHWPWAPVVHGWHATERWWQDATDLRGVDPHHREVVRFFARQWLDMLAPSNAGLANPEVLQRTAERGGANLVDGTLHALDEWRRQHGLEPLRTPERRYEPGVDVAVTPGQVVWRNHLVELIQYLPLTASVQAEPVFIVPSWIMKYYILDLSPHNSFVKWLVEQGHTVFILSWRNPDESDALLAMQDYLELGIFDPLAQIARMIPGRRVHACGYCLGGTLLSLAAAALARPGRIARAELLPELASVSLLAAETDFTEPGEMGVLIDESQVTLLEDMMAERGFLTGAQMAGSFAYLHSRDQVWSRRLREFWLGEPDSPNDLMAWNADLTRMPAAMHSEYLRRCYLRNEIAEGRFPVEGRAVSLSDIAAPMFVVGTEKDHVSPWKSVYKIHRLADTTITFVLTSGGHNAGIVSEPGHANRRYRMATREVDGAWVDPQAWAEQAPRHEGSWWTAWHDWLLAQGSGETAKARTPAKADVVCAAPGTYVHQCWRD
ncbi:MULTISPECIES: alpha/beta hydrolase [unclassified Rubrivivax]|uniref:PHA/PHB synthase family protein n=1 Tax=unclassified Rubrivivax TaxID=2649762 RepID=UPI001E5A0812|nr:MULTISPECIES: alpha/beta fold hydrolase [unclassified Rubrivivax]MCC9596293.1 alpha/beta fold hydrolase [Rubrivivax sp. JA1055]MCC9647366.1 alpha/beta fold hydrolase [Rubrivivax sp. JA1029]